MPIRNQQVIHDDLQYVPPPNAYHNAQQYDSNQEGHQEKAKTSKVRSVEVGKTKRRLFAVAKATKSAFGALHTSLQESARVRAERKVQEAQHEATIFLEEPSPAQTQSSKRVTQRGMAETQPTSVQKAGVGWGQQFYVYTALLFVGYGIWILDGAFTVLGGMKTFLPFNILGLILGVLLHFVISWGQHSLIYNRNSWLKGIGFGMLFANAVSNVYGVNAAIRYFRPELLGTLPEAPMDWLIGTGVWVAATFQKTITASAAAQQGKVLSSSPQTPIWLFQAIIVIIGAFILAWYAEKIRNFFQSQWTQIWEQRPE